MGDEGSRLGELGSLIVDGVGEGRVRRVVLMLRQRVAVVLVDGVLRECRRRDVGRL